MPVCRVCSCATLHMPGIGKQALSHTRPTCHHKVLQPTAQLLTMHMGQKQQRCLSDSADRHYPRPIGWHLCHGICQHTAALALLVLQSSLQAALSAEHAFRVTNFSRSCCTSVPAPNTHALAIRRSLKPVTNTQQVATSMLLHSTEKQSQSNA